MKNTTKSSSRRLPAKELPVSRKYYKGLISRVDDVIRAVFMEPNSYLFESAYNMIDHYLTHNTLEGFELPPVAELRVIFLTLKAEIDRARERSLRARERARNRTALKYNETADTKVSGEPLSEPAEEIMDHRSASNILLPYIRRLSHRYVLTISKKEALEKLKVPEGLYDAICDDLIQANRGLQRR